MFEGGKFSDQSFTVSGWESPVLGSSWEKLFSQVFSLRLTGEKTSMQLKRMRGGKLNTEQTLIVQISLQVFV